jgi:hypothetical protein
VRCNTDRSSRVSADTSKPYYSGYTTPPDFASGNYKEEKSKLCGRSLTDNVPVGTVNLRSDDGTVVQPIIYDRFIYANQRSVLSGLGDRIRGDLPILPNNTNWFQVAANPTIDLTNSALAVMSGNGETAKQLQALKTALTNGTQNTWGSMGNIDNSVQKQMMLNAAQGDVQWTSFP